MRLTVIKLGKIVFSEIESMAEMYEERLSGFATVQTHVLKDPSAGNTPSFLTPPLKKILDQTDFIVGLHERGLVWTSEQFSTKLKKWVDDSAIKNLCFLVGGPFGWGQEIESLIDVKWSLSGCTLQGDVAWLVLWEQLYRATAIIKGSSYHHG